MFNQRMHKVFVNTYLFHITPVRFDIEVLSSGRCSYAQVKGSWIPSIIICGR